MFQHDFQFFVDLMIFFSKKRRSAQTFLFYIYFSHLCKISKKINLVTTCVFECFQLGGHILKKLHVFLCMMGAITIFGENGFKFNYVDYGLVTISLGARGTFEGVVEKTKCQKMNVNV